MTTETPRPPRAAAFDAVAPDYEASTPPYPDRAIEWLLPQGAVAGLDLGAGTGQLARHLTARGIAAVAVEPSAGMRHAFAKVLPDIPIHAGSAEDIPLPDAAVDVVLVGHAWHSVELDRAVPEVARVLRPGGRLSLIWNVRDERVDWVRDLDRIVHRRPKHVVDSENPTVGPPFAPIERYDVEWTHTQTKAEFVETVAKRITGIAAAAAQRAEILADLERLLSDHPTLAGGDSVSVPYVARCSRTHRP
ncbi:class I SAM-dependent methyltransferase [Nocardia africana]|uniref:Class I SAM-dependent methyltransferase n=1 Tax=Nocardia africana TaxID=134964 RepID=A0ABW6NN68_9NOCA